MLHEAASTRIRTRMRQSNEQQIAKRIRSLGIHFGARFTLGLIFLFLGFLLSIASLWPFNIVPPREPFEIGVGPSDQCRVDHTEVYFYIPARSIRVIIFLNSCVGKQYNAYVLIPFVVNNATSSAFSLSDKALLTNSSFKNVTECNACIANSTFCSEEIVSDLKVDFLFSISSDLFQSDLLGSSKAVAVTFFGPQSDLVYNETYKYHGTRSTVTISSPLFVHFNLPSDARFSHESFPVPIQYYMRNDQMWVMFNPTFPNNNYAQTIACHFVNPLVQGIKQLVFLAGGIFIGLATSLVVEVQLHQAEAGERRHEFWKRLLDKSKTKATLFANTSPSKGNHISAAAGISGIYYQYLILENEARVQLSIESGDSRKNKSVFDELYSNREQIETDFGDQLVWERLEGKKTSRISKTVISKGLKDTESWPEISDEMIDSMCRLERALSKQIRR